MSDLLTLGEALATLAYIVSTGLIALGAFAMAGGIAVEQIRKGKKQ